jgi:hypothetical protein
VAAQLKPWTFKRWKESKDPNKLQHSFPAIVRAINEGKSVSDKVGSVKQSPSLKVGERRNLLPRPMCVPFQDLADLVS